MNGKGSKPRPFSVGKTEWDLRHQATFGTPEGKIEAITELVKLKVYTEDYLKEKKEEYGLI
jgi:hypothetical protein